MLGYDAIENWSNDKLPGKLAPIILLLEDLREALGLRSCYPFGPITEEQLIENLTIMKPIEKAVEDLDPIGNKALKVARKSRILREKWEVSEGEQKDELLDACIASTSLAILPISQQVMDTNEKAVLGAECPHASPACADPASSLSTPVGDLLETAARIYDSGKTDAEKGAAKREKAKKRRNRRRKAKKGKNGSKR